ncbi:DUF2970 domain-containing protein [Methylonatrum kenyense]|uniref:DUF2970 domain-containing protein n=1 Tax=Methylonatrum kenyense TaxID=455253 RepID=UPI0020BEC5CB|nr:DUF2970 domain-containing protein [Methylonatrum kenyense]MCK8516100.1 DUF2970 domain-containing protein [Methylonatrum kenyense]
MFAKISKGRGDGPRQDQDETKRPGVLAVIQSTLAAAFGVQSQKARERDFKYGRPLPYIIAGTIFTVAFILLLVLIVRLVLSSAGLD